MVTEGGWGFSIRRKQKHQAAPKSLPLNFQEFYERGVTVISKKLIINT